MAKRKGASTEPKPLSRAKLERTVLAQATQEDLADPEALKAYFREEPLAPAAAKLLDDDEAFGALLDKARETAPAAADADAAGARPHDIGWILQDALDVLLPLSEKAERTGLSPKDADEVRWRLDELFTAYAALRWTLLHGAPPTREDWGGTDPAQRGWPTVALVEELFESFEKLHAVTGITESKTGEGFAALTEAAQKAEAAEARARQVLADAEAQEARRRELARQVEQAKVKADAERGATLAAEGRAERAEARVAELEAALAARPDAPAPVPAAAPAAEAVLAENASLRGHVEQLAAQVAELQARLDDEHRRAAYVPPTVTATDAPAADAGGQGSHYAAVRDRLDAMPEPESVRAAVDLAADELTPHLVFAERAYESADDSPFRAPRILLGDLVKLDRIAEMYLRGDIGTSLHTIARELNLDWVEDANAADHGVRGRHYRYDHAGREWVLRPHVRVGGRAPGANATARIYVTLHEGDDDVPRQVIVGHVGRKLPDTTT